MNHYVYETTNNVNGKKYIGKHSTKSEIFADDYYGSGEIIRKAINKYGKKNFSRRLLGVFETSDEAFDFEEQEIERVGAYYDSNYYNLVKGGKDGYFKMDEYERCDLELDYLDLPLIIDPDDVISNFKIILHKTKGYKPYYINFYIAYRLYHGADKDKLVNEVYELIKNFSISQRYSHKVISRLINSINNIPHNDIERLCLKSDIVIRKSEMEMIKLVNHDAYCRALTVFLMFYKRFANSNDDWVKYEESTLFKYSHFTLDRQQFCEILENLNLIEFDDYGVEYRIPFADFSDSPIFVALPTISSDSYMLYKYYVQGEVYYCKECGGIMKTNKQHSTLYCNDCRGYHRNEFKVFTCVDCGKEFIVDSNVANKKRCDSCQKLRDKETRKERNRRYYDKKTGKCRLTVQ